VVWLRTVVLSLQRWRPSRYLCLDPVFANNVLYLLQMILSSGLAIHIACSHSNPGRTDLSRFKGQPRIPACLEYRIILYMVSQSIA
jgi:hypothetical protein